MDMITMQQLKELGVDTDDAMKRFMNKEDLFIKFFVRFAEDSSYQNLKEKMAERDCEEAFKQAHTLKGVVANLSIRCIYEVLVPVVEALRNGEFELAEEVMPALEQECEKVICFINERKA